MSSSADTLAAPASAPTPESLPRQRILRQARAHFFSHGYSQCTMDDLAADLGMSKKTLYVHFAGKDEIIAALLDDIAEEIRTEAEALLRHRDLNLAEKLRGFVEGMAERLGKLDPRIVRDLQRFAPHLYARVEALREKNIPYVFGRFIEEGQIAGLVRDDINVTFAIEFYLQAIQGLMHPAALERLNLTPREVIARAVDQFFGGLLTPNGRKQYEKLFPR